MNVLTFALLLASVLLSAAAQLLLKVGMSAVPVREALASRQVMGLLMAVGLSPGVIGGLVAYGASAAVWLLVLTRVDVSQAYPCVALAFVATMAGAHVFLGEPLGTWRIAGAAIIILGVIIVARS
jgi:drug/metabolite transporter (DMT)-like permease